MPRRCNTSAPPELARIASRWRELATHADTPARSGALEASFETHGLGNLFHKIREELGLEDMSDLHFIRREELDAVPWLRPIPKNKLLALISEVCLNKHILKCALNTKIKNEICAYNTIRAYSTYSI